MILGVLETVQNAICRLNINIAHHQSQYQQQNRFSKRSSSTGFKKQFTNEMKVNKKFQKKKNVNSKSEKIYTKVIKRTDIKSNLLQNSNFLRYQM